MEHHGHVPIPFMAGEVPSWGLAGAPGLPHQQHPAYKPKRPYPLWLEGSGAANEGMQLPPAGDLLTCGAHRGVNSMDAAQNCFTCGRLPSSSMSEECFNVGALLSPYPRQRAWPQPAMQAALPLHLAGNFAKEPLQERAAPNVGAWAAAKVDAAGRVMKDTREMVVPWGQGLNCGAGKLGRVLGKGVPPAEVIDLCSVDEHPDGADAAAPHSGLNHEVSQGSVHAESSNVVCGVLPGRGDEDLLPDCDLLLSFAERAQPPQRPEARKDCSAMPLSAALSQTSYLTEAGESSTTADFVFRDTQRRGPYGRQGPSTRPSKTASLKALVASGLYWVAGLRPSNPVQRKPAAKGVPRQASRAAKRSVSPPRAGGHARKKQRHFDDTALGHAAPASALSAQHLNTPQSSAMQDGGDAHALGSGPAVTASRASWSGGGERRPSGMALDSPPRLLNAPSHAPQPGDPVHDSDPAGSNRYPPAEPAGSAELHGASPSDDVTAHARHESAPVDALLSDVALIHGAWLHRSAPSLQASLPQTRRVVRTIPVKVHDCDGTARTVQVTVNDYGSCDD